MYDNIHCSEAYLVVCRANSPTSTFQALKTWKLWNVLLRRAEQEDENGVVA